MKLEQISPNFHRLIADNYQVVFSYATPIAIETAHGYAYVAKNQWSKTTGKHINEVKRQYDAFDVSYDQLLEIIRMETQ